MQPRSRRFAPSRRGAYFLVSIMILLLGTACGGDEEAPPAATTPSPTEDVAEDSELPLGEIPAGTFTYEIGERTLTFTLDSGWSWYGAGTGGDVLELQHGEPAEPPELEAITVFAAAEDPSEAIAGLRELPGVKISDETETSLAGASGTRVSVSVGPQAEEPVLFTFEDGGGHYGLASGNRAEIFVLDLDSRTLVVSIEGPEERFDEFLRTAEDVVQSMEITQPR